MLNDKNRLFWPKYSSNVSQQSGKTQKTANLMVQYDTKIREKIFSKSKNVQTLGLFRCVTDSAG